MRIDNRYDVERELGHGAMGVVYLARDIILKRPVAIKTVGAPWNESQSFLDAFRREAAAIAAIRNAHVVQIHAFGTDTVGDFFVMEYVEGRDLYSIIHEYLAHQSFIPGYRALTILRQVAAGLAAIHQAGLVHRDLKPSNIVIEEGSGRPVIIDFGLAFHRDENQLNQLGGGTPHYMSPELIQSANYAGATIQSDLYALACTGFELFCGRPPFVAASQLALFEMHLLHEPPVLSSLRPGFAPFDPVFAKALAKDPRERYQSTTEFVRALEAAAVRWGADLNTSTTLAPDTNPSGGLRVLVVDDDDFFRKVALRAVQIVFFGQKVRVLAVSSGVAALESLQEKPADLILLDCDMPGIDGIETLARLREAPGGARARITVISANLGREERWRFSVLGVQDFIGKPIEMTELVSTLQKIAQKNRWVSPE